MRLPKSLLPGSSVTLVAIALLVPALDLPAQDRVGSKWTAENSDPTRLGWMRGFPPPPEKRIRSTDQDYFSFPKLRWTVCNFQQLLPSVEVSRGIGAPVPFKRRLDGNIDRIDFTPLGGGAKMTWEESLGANFTDGIVVLHRGVIVYERYSGLLDDTKKHAAMSVTKSLVGLLAELLVAEGRLDEDATVSSIIPELSDSAFGSATVRQVMEMTTALKYSEDYADPKADVWDYGAAGSPFPKPAGYEGPRTYYEFLVTVKPAGTHGSAFAYKTPNTDVLGWIVARKAGQSVAALLAERIWSRMGAEQAAFFTVDSTGTPFVGGGFNCGLRDLARLGQLLLDDGQFHGQQLIPEAAIRRIRKGGSQAAFAKAGYETLPGASYRSMWWIFHNKHGAFAARGVHGQALYMDPTAQMVIARFASHPTAANSANDPTTLPAFQALAEYLIEAHRE